MPSLRRNFSWTLIGNAVSMACNWGTLVVLAKLGSPVLVGQFALGLAVTAPIIMFTNLQLRSVQATDTGTHFAFGDYAGLRLAMTALALAVIAGLTFAGGYSAELTCVILLVGLLKALDAVSDVIFGVFQRHEVMDRIAVAMIAKGILGLSAFTAVLLDGGKLTWAIATQLGSSAVVVLAYEIPSAARLTGGAVALLPSLRWRILGRLLRLALPLGVVMMFISLNTNLPRYFIEHQFGERELGIFAALAYLMTAGTAVVAALGQSATPRLARLFAARDARGFQQLVARLLFVGAGLGLAGLVVVLGAGRTILQFVYTPEYATHSGILAVLMLAAAIGYLASFLGYALTAARCFDVQAPLAAGVAVVTAGVCLWLVPQGGALGAAWALVVSAAAQLTGNATVLKRAIGKRVAGT